MAFKDIIRDIKEGAEVFTSKEAREEAATGIGEFFKPSPEVRIRDIIREIPSGISTIVKRETPIQRKIEGVVSGFLTPEKEVKEEAQRILEVSKGKPEKEIKSDIEKMINKKYSEYLLSPPVSKIEIKKGKVDVDISPPVDPFGAVGMAREVGIKLSKRALGKIAKSNVVGDIFKILKRGATDISDDVLKSLSDDLVNIKDTKKIGEIIANRIKSPKVTIKGITKVEPTPRTISDVKNSPAIFKLPDVGVKQLEVPKTAIGEIKRKISRIRGERLQGYINAQKADDLVKNLNKELTTEAKKSGIAVIDNTPIIRKSGVYVPSKFETHNFKDISGLITGRKAISLNLDDAVLQIDNRGFKEMAREGLGPLSEIQYKKSQATAALIEFGEQTTDNVKKILNRYGIKVNKESGIQAMLSAHGLTNDLIKSKGVRQAIIETLEKADISKEAISQALQPGFLSRIVRGKSAIIKAVENGIPQNIENAVSGGLRPHLDDLLKEANKIRSQLDKDLIKRRKNYGPVIQNTAFWSKLRSEPKTTITDAFDYIIPNAKKNPHAQPRNAGAKDVEWNLWKALPRYYEAIGQDIYHAPIIEQLKAANRALKLRGFNNSVDFIQRNIRENIVGQPGAFDAFFGLTTQSKANTWLNAINRARITSVLSFNLIWSTFVQPASMILTAARSTTGKGVSGLVFGPADVAKGITKFITSAGRRAKVKSLPTVRIKAAGKSIGKTGLGDLDEMGNKIMKSKWDTIDGYLRLYADWMEYNLTGMSSSVGYEMGKRAGMKGKKANFIADWMGGATQSRYNREARPMILNNLLVRSNFPFNTYLMELYRLNKSILNKGGGMPLGGWERFNTAVGLLGSMYLYDKYVIEPAIGRRLMRPSTFIPLAGHEFEKLLNEGIEATGLADKEIPVISPTLKEVQEETEQFGFKPTGALLSDAHRVVGAFDSYIRHANIQPLRKEITKWGMGFRGVGGAATLNRFIDGLIANANEFQTNRAKEELFRIEGIDKYLSPLVGPYSTRAGISYLRDGGSIVAQDARKEKKELDELSREEAKDKFNEIRERNPELARQINTLIEDEKNPILGEVRGLGIKNGMRAQKIVEELNKLPAEDRAEEYDKLVDAGVITKSVSKQVEELLEKERKAALGEDPELNDGEPRDDKSIINIIWLYSKAIGTDPITAFDRILGGEKIRRIDNGAIIIEKVFEETQKIRGRRARQSELKGMRLDHTIPTQLGGSNKPSNLILVSKEEWEGYTPIENLLGDHLRRETISKKEAQKLIRQFKEGKISAEEIKRQYPPTGEGMYEKFK